MIILLHYICSEFSFLVHFSVPKIPKFTVDKKVSDRFNSGGRSSSSDALCFSSNSNRSQRQACKSCVDLYSYTKVETNLFFYYTLDSLFTIIIIIMQTLFKINKENTRQCSGHLQLIPTDKNISDFFHC